jgi:hypothetical protein
MSSSTDHQDRIYSLLALEPHYPTGRIYRWRAYGDSIPYVTTVETVTIASFMSIVLYHARSYLEDRSLLWFGDPLSTAVMEGTPTFFRVDRGYQVTLTLKDGKTARTTLFDHTTVKFQQELHFE